LLRERFTRGLGVGIERGRLRRWRCGAAQAQRPPCQIAKWRDGRSCDLTNTRSVSLENKIIMKFAKAGKAKIGKPKTQIFYTVIFSEIHNA
jgi:hypothetical protein